MLVSALQLARNRAYGGSRARRKIAPLAYNRLKEIKILRNQQLQSLPQSPECSGVVREVPNHNTTNLYLDYNNLLVNCKQFRYDSYASITRGGVRLHVFVWHIHQSYKLRSAKTHP